MRMVINDWGRKSGSIVSQMLNPKEILRCNTLVPNRAKKKTFHFVLSLSRPLNMIFMIFSFLFPILPKILHTYHFLITTLSIPFFLQILFALLYLAKT